MDTIPFGKRTRARPRYGFKWCEMVGRKRITRGEEEEEEEQRRGSGTEEKERRRSGKEEEMGRRS